MLVRGEFELDERGGRPGSAVRDRPRPVRGVPQRPAGRRRRAHAGVHRVPRPAPGPDLRRRRSAPTRLRTPWARSCPTAGTAARSGCRAPHDQWGPELGPPGPAAGRLRGRLDRRRGHRLERWRSARSHIEAADLIAGQSVDLRRRRRGLERAGFDDAGLGSRRGRRPRLRRPRGLAGAAGPRGAGAGAGVGAPGGARAGVRPRPEHQRLGAAAEPRAGGDGAHPDARRGARRRRRRHHRAPRRRPAVHPGAAAARARSTGSSRRAGRATCSNRGTPRTASATCASRGTRAARRRRSHRRRRAHRPDPDRLVPLQRRAHQPAARGGRLELARQRLRHPDRLPDARARRLDRRLADLRRDRRVPLRRRRVLRQVAARPGRGAVVERAGRQPGAEPAVGIRRRLAGRAERVGRLGRRRGDRPLGDLPRVRRPPRCSRSSGRRWWPGCRMWSARPPARGIRSASRAGPTRCRHERYLWDTGFHWGEWLVPGRGAEGSRGVRGVPARRQVRRGDRLLRALGAADEQDRGRARARARRARATASSPTASALAWRAEFLGPDGRLSP